MHYLRKIVKIAVVVNAMKTFCFKLYKSKQDLNIKAMQRLYGRKIGDLAFSEFVEILKYEASKLIRNA